MDDSYVILDDDGNPESIVVTASNYDTEGKWINNKHYVIDYYSDEELNKINIINKIKSDPKRGHYSMIPFVNDGVSKETLLKSSLIKDDHNDTILKSIIKRFDTNSKNSTTYRYEECSTPHRKIFEIYLKKVDDPSTDNESRVMTITINDKDDFPSVTFNDSDESFNPELLEYIMDTISELRYNPRPLLNSK